MLDVHAWAPYWALEDASPTLQTRADTLHQVSPLWFRATDVDTIEIEPDAPADATEEFMDTGRAGAACRSSPSILDAHRAPA